MTRVSYLARLLDESFEELHSVFGIGQRCDLRLQPLRVLAIGRVL